MTSREGTVDSSSKAEVSGASQEEIHRMIVRRQIRAGVLAFFAAGMIATGAPNAEASPKVCWSPTALAHKPSLKEIKKGDEAYRPKPRWMSVLPPPTRAPVGAIRRVELPVESPKLIALTFDLCEQPYEIAGYDGAIVDILRSRDISATFFAGGKWLQTHEEQAFQLMGDPLFELGNHTWEHRNLRVVEKPSELRDEIRGTQLVYERLWSRLYKRQCLARDEKNFAHEYASDRLSLFRFPFGACSPGALEAVAAHGLHAIQWDVSSGDSTPGLTAEQIAKGVVNGVRPGSIVLFHANGRGWKTAAALPIIIDQLTRQKYKFVTVSTLIHTPGAKRDIRPICFDNQPGDTNRYDLFSRQLHRTYEDFNNRRNIIPPKPELRSSRFPAENP